MFRTLILLSFAFNGLDCTSTHRRESVVQNSEDPWRKVHLQSTNQTEIAISFQNKYIKPQSSPGGRLAGDLATPLWVNLSHPTTQFKGSEGVMAEFIRYCRPLEGPRSLEWKRCGSETLRLIHVNGENRYTGELPGLVLLTPGEPSLQQCSAYEVKVFVGREGFYDLVDPLSGRKRFVINLFSPVLNKRCQAD